MWSITSYAQTQPPQPSLSPTPVLLSSTDLVQIPQKKTFEIRGTIQEVTLYKEGTALVSRLVSIPDLPIGVHEIVITDLPSKTEQASVYADQAHNVQIRSVAFRSSQIKTPQATQSKLQKQEQELKALRRKASSIHNQIRLLRRRQEILKKLDHFGSTTAKKELHQGLLKAKELEYLTLMQFKEYESASNRILDLEFQKEDLQTQINRLQHQQNQVAQSSSLRYDAVVLLDKKTPQASFRLNYLIKDCGWTPVYHVKGSSQDQKKAVLEFNALIHQVSGENWDNVNLHLSTASPKNSAFNPILSPLYVRVSHDSPPPTLQRQSRHHVLGHLGNRFDAQNSYNTALIQRKNAMRGQFKGHSFEEMANANFDANASAASVQLFEISKQVSELRSLQDQLTEDDLNIHYQLQNLVSLPSRREGQMIPVFQKEISASYYRVATPILTPSIFREAELVNSTTQDLLGGQVNVYLDGTFTGKTSIPTIARGRTFTLGFGVDGQLRTHRTVLDRTESVQGGNKQLTLHVKIMVDNYHHQTTRVLLKERMPYMDDVSRLRVSLKKTSLPLSKGAHYTRVEKPKGILLWDLQVPSGSEDQAMHLTYTYTVEFDKNLSVQEIAREQKSQLRGKFLMESKHRMRKKMRKQ